MGQDADQSESEKDPIAYKVILVNVTSRTQVYKFTTSKSEAKMCWMPVLRLEFFYYVILNMQVWGGGA